MKAELASTPDRSGRRAIIVVGLHRCGTSALTRTLSLAGATLPRNLMLPGDGLATDGNSRSGFWESRPLAEVDEAALQSARTAWDDPVEPTDEWFASASAARLQTRLARTIQTEFGDAPLFIAKDPRISRLVPLWARALADLGIEPARVIAVRNPIEAASSLALRDGFSMPKGHWLWLRHFLVAERDTRGMSRAIVSFDELLSDWRGVLDRVGGMLALPLRASEEIAAEIDDFLAPALRHHVVSSTELATREDIPGALREAFEWAVRASREGEIETAGLDESLREARRSEAAAKAESAAAARARLAAVGPVGQPGAVVKRASCAPTWSASAWRTSSESSACSRGSNRSAAGSARSRRGWRRPPRPRR